MKFEEALKLPWVEGVPGNAAALVKLFDEVEDVREWHDGDWLGMRMVYYSMIEDPCSAWLHDIYKYRCKFDIEKMYEYLEDLREEIDNL